MFQGRCNLKDFFHPRTHGTATDENHDVAWLNPLRPMTLDRVNGRSLADEDARGTDLSINTVSIDDARIDCRALDNRSLRCKISARECHRAGQSALDGALRAHNHIIGIDTFILLQPLA